MGPNSRIALFVVASLLGHTALTTILPHYVPTVSPPPNEPVAFTLVPLNDEPAPDPVVEEEPPPDLPEPPRRVVRVAREAPSEPQEVSTDQTADETPEVAGDTNANDEASDAAGDAQGTVNAVSEGGLNVGRPAGAGNDGAAQGTQRRGDPAPAIDRRALIQRYLREVQRSLGAPTETRALQRAGLEGVVMVALRVDPAGHVLGVRVRRSSGLELLDEAALAHVRQHAEVPAPPEALDWVTREITLPVRYQTRRRR